VYEVVKVKNAAIPAKITFFMPVIEKNIAIADYCVRSYAKIRDIPFSLAIYLNYISERSKKKYVSRWRRFNFVEIMEDELQQSLYPHWLVLDRQLRKIKTPYVATVDYDFEILDPKFIKDMLSKLDENDNLVALSTNFYSAHSRYPKNVKTLLMPCWNPWFCIYKQKALQCAVSHSEYTEHIPGQDTPIFYDTSSRFQRALIDDYGYELASLPKHEYRHFYLHYESMAWSKKGVNEKNTFLYRWLKILSRNGIFGRGRFVVHTANILLRKIFKPSER
jgi:hypothetical protein